MVNTIKSHISIRGNFFLYYVRKNTIFNHFKYFKEKNNIKIMPFYLAVKALKSYSVFSE